MKKQATIKYALELFNELDEKIENLIWSCGCNDCEECENFSTCHIAEFLFELEGLINSYRYDCIKEKIAAEKAKEEDGKISTL